MLRDVGAEEVLSSSGTGLSLGDNSAVISVEGSVCGGCSSGVVMSFSGSKIGFSSLGNSEGASIFSSFSITVTGRAVVSFSSGAGGEGGGVVVASRVGS